MAKKQEQCPLCEKMVCNVVRHLMTKSHNLSKEEAKQWKTFFMNKPSSSRRSRFPKDCRSFIRCSICGRTATKIEKHLKNYHKLTPLDIDYEDALSASIVFKDDTIG